MLALRSAWWIWAAVIMAITLLPEPDFGGFEFSSSMVQGIGFAVGAVLLALSDRNRPYFFRRRSESQNLPRYLVVRFKRHLVRIAVMLISYAVLLEIGQYFEVGRSFGFAQLAQNTGWVLLACVTLYVLARIFLVGPYLNRITQKHLGRVSAAFRCEAAYSAHLRDLIQAAYAMCVASSLSGEDRIHRVRQLLEKALAAEMPKHSEEILDAVFGVRTVGPALSRPSIDHNASPIIREET
jgi:hypothetical protein